MFWGRLATSGQSAVGPSAKDLVQIPESQALIALTSGILQIGLSSLFSCVGVLLEGSSWEAVVLHLITETLGLCELLIYHQVQGIPTPSRSLP